ncbi:hypothetical protein IEQ34_009372 [Dendrobium chrysotoxum]|uniref:C2H2-type domain-containing protein n=1 Tax=Dendrobium chrysotoxum TaxID=161865 RepID=A0AAV7H0E4_DENCH|nr:hypothetical protein IEQ34_009372 [Dendrobium chrysotoxum]
MAKRFRLVSEEEDDMVSTICTDSFNLANVLMLLSRGHATAAAAGGEATEGKVFECKTCSRKFTTFQALGGHRASHKKPRMGGRQPPPPRRRSQRCTSALSADWSSPSARRSVVT